MGYLALTTLYHIEYFQLMENLMTWTLKFPLSLGPWNAASGCLDSLGFLFSIDKIPFLGDRLVWHATMAIETREHNSKIHSKCPGSRRKGRGVWACSVQNMCVSSVLTSYREDSVSGEKLFRSLPFTLSAPLTSKTNEFFETWKASAVRLTWSSSCCRELPSVQTSWADCPCSAFYRKQGRSWHGRLALGKLKTDHMDYNQIKSVRGGSRERTTLSGFLEMSIFWSLALRIWREATFSATGRGGLRPRIGWN